MRGAFDSRRDNLFLERQERGEQCSGFYPTLFPHCTELYCLSQKTDDNILETKRATYQRSTGVRTTEFSMPFQMEKDFWILDV